MPGTMEPALLKKIEELLDDPEIKKSLRSVYAVLHGRHGAQGHPKRCPCWLGHGEGDPNAVQCELAADPPHKHHEGIAIRYWDS